MSCQHSRGQNSWCINNFKYKQHPAEILTKQQPWKLCHHGTMLLLVPRGAGITLLMGSSFFTHHKQLDTSEQQLLCPSSIAAPREKITYQGYVTPSSFEGRAHSDLPVPPPVIHDLKTPSCFQATPGTTAKRGLTLQREVLLFNTYILTNLSGTHGTKKRILLYFSCFCQKICSKNT